MNSENLTAHVTASHDPEPPKLPPLPEAIVLTWHPKQCMDYWSAHHTNPISPEDFSKSMRGKGYFTRTLTISQPQPPREVTDAEVAAIIRSVIPGWNRDCDTTVLASFSQHAACVRAALRKAGA